ncbi:MAG: PD-(D/E)XK nuclease family protein [Myxococcaceae bacterium]|nr:PD-(D/E)XK nuclease family protein [Myxococcaceae bacterium]
MRKVLVNGFSWSKTRHERFSSCRRAYFFTYYLSWGGWEDNAAPFRKQLYTLKKLSNRYTWSGSVVHAAIRGVLMAARHGRTLEPARVIERVHRVMQQDFVFSRSRAYWQTRGRKEFSGLVEHEYGEPVEPSQWKENWESVRKALEWFFSSRWLPLAKRLKPEQWLEVDFMDFEHSVFLMHDVRIFAVPDFAYIEDDGSTVIVDWKTGQAREGYDDQVLGYALYLASRYQRPLETMKASLVYVTEGVEKSVSVDPLALEGFKNRFAESVREMKGLLLNAANNEPMPEQHFPMSSDMEVCARCVYRRICKREHLKPGLVKVVPEPTAEP